MEQVKTTHGFGEFKLNQSTNTNRQRKRFYLEYGDNIYRVLPPVHSLAAEGKIAKYWHVIWLKAPNGKTMPIPSILQKDRNKNIIRQDPLLLKLEQINAALAAATQKNDLEAIAQLKKLQERIQERKFYALNVMSPSGEVGVLSVPYTAYQSLLLQLKKLEIDPIGIGPDRGLFLNFRKARDEKGRVIYTVEPATKVTRTNGDMIVSYLKAPISEEEAARVHALTEDLAKLYTPLSVEKMELLSDLSQESFDLVFGSGTKNNEADMQEEASTGSEQNNLLSFVAAEMESQSKTSSTQSLANNTDYEQILKIITGKG